MSKTLCLFLPRQTLKRSLSNVDVQEFSNTTDFIHYFAKHALFFLLASRSFRSASDRKENICLSLLHSWHTLPICGYHLVPEHVECRALTNSEKSGLEQVSVKISHFIARIYLSMKEDAKRGRLRKADWNRLPRK